MKAKFLSFIVLISLSLVLSSQTYMVGYQYMSAHDDDRDRDISTTVFYPSDIGGEDAAISDGVFPAVIFGHGTAMADETLYDYICDALVAEGYIVLFPTTENDSPPLGAPDHEDFGLDLKHLNLVIKFENTNAGSFFYGHVSDKTAIMGHSLGGKGTLIAAANNTEVTTIVTLCAALSNPPFPYSGSGYDAINNSLPFITVPSLIVDAELDCVVPDDEGHYMIYEDIPVDCKTYVNIIGGGHCYMASHDGSVCESAESGLFGCGDDFTISREEQNATVLEIILPYLRYYLYDDETAYSEFLCYLSTTDDVTSERACAELPDAEIDGIDIDGEVENITVAYGTDLTTATNQLAAQITIDDVYGVEHTVSLNWSVAGYNATISGDYTATGSFTLPTCVEQTSPATELIVTATITVENAVSIGQFEAYKSIEIFPNPAKDIINYELNMGGANDIITIYNTCGQELISVTAKKAGSIDISNLESGIYIIKFHKNTIKLIVE